MPLIRRIWTAKNADEWTKEDLMTCIVSPLIYFLLTIGVALSALLIPVGFLLLGVGILLIVVLVYMINPKLSVISEDYEKKQKKYLEALEKKLKWEE